MQMFYATVQPTCPRGNIQAFASYATHLSQKSGHLYGELFIYREMTCCNLLISLIGQEQALSLSLSSQLLREVQPEKKRKMLA